VAGGPDYAGKPRPAVILQDDAFDATRSVTLCPLTGIEAEVSIRPLIAPSAENGLRAPSRLMVDKITTVSREKVQRRIGRLSRADLSQMARSILTFLGLAGNNT
jgi:mRNA interferase MazF